MFSLSTYTPDKRETSDGLATVDRMTAPAAESEVLIPSPRRPSLTVICNQARPHPLTDHRQPEAYAYSPDNLHSCFVDDSHGQEVFPIQARAGLEFGLNGQ